MAGREGGHSQSGGKMSNIASKETLEQGINMIAPVAVEVSEPCDAWGDSSKWGTKKKGGGCGGQWGRMSALLTTQGVGR